MTDNKTLQIDTTVHPWTFAIDGKSITEAEAFELLRHKHPLEAENASLRASLLAKERECEATNNLRYILGEVCKAYDFPIEDAGIPLGKLFSDIRERDQLKEQKAELETSLRNTQQELDTVIASRAEMEERLAALQPGTVEAIVNSMFEAADKLGRSPVSSKHALSFLLGKIKDLESQLQSAREGNARGASQLQELLKASNGRSIPQLLQEITALKEGLKNLVNSREVCHANYNGGHHETETNEAFHHGMDTVFNVIDNAAKLLLSTEDKSTETG